MIAYKTEKINNAICFFAKEVYKLRKQYLPQTLLYKFLSYLDFFSIEKLGKPALELEYRAYKNGPVPVSIYNNREGYQTDCFKFEKKGTNKFIVISTMEADLDYFSEFEIETMNYLLDKYVKNNLSMEKIIDNIYKKIAIMRLKHGKWHTIGKRMVGLIIVIHSRNLIKKKTINFPCKKKGFWFIVV